MGRMETLSRNFNIALSLCIWSCIAVIPIMNTKSLEVIFWLLLLSFIFNPAKWQRIQDNAPFLILMLQYPIINILRIYFTPAHDYEIISSPTEYEMWIYCIIALFLATAFFDDKSTRRYARVFLPLSIILTFGLAAYEFHIIGSRSIAMLNANVFEAPLFATTLSFIFFAMVNKDQKLAVAFASFLIGLTIVLATSYTARRGIFLGQVVALASAGVLLMFSRKYKLGAILIVTIVTFILVGYITDLSSNGAFWGRLDVIFDLLLENQKEAAFVLLAVCFIFFVSSFSQIIEKFKLNKRYFIVASIAVALTLAASSVFYLNSFETFETIKQTLNDNRNIANQSDPGSTGVRLSFAYQGVISLQDNLLFGLGAHVEPYLAEEILSGHMHLHNNYLSWLIWGGLITLSSGLIWLFAPVVLIKKSHDFTIAIPCLMIALLWSVSLLFDSFFSWKNFTYVYIALICLGYQISRTSDSAAT